MKRTPPLPPNPEMLDDIPAVLADDLGEQGTAAELNAKLFLVRGYARQAYREGMRAKQNSDLLWRPIVKSQREHIGMLGKELERATEELGEKRNVNMMDIHPAWLTRTRSNDTPRPSLAEAWL